MKVKESCCNECPECISCGRKYEVFFYHICDRCGREEQLYVWDNGEELCAECLLKEFDEVDMEE